MFWSSLALVLARFCLIFATADEKFSEGQRKCQLYLPFESNFDDHSQQPSKIFGQTEISFRQNFRNAHSAEFRGRGFLEVELNPPNLSQTFTLCLSYSCRGFETKCEGFMATTRHFSLLLLNGNFVKVQFGKDSFAGIVEPSKSPDQFNQVCLVANENEVALFLNGEVAEAKTLRALASNFDRLFVGSSPQVAGNFSGILDDLLLCPWAFDETDMVAHFDGPDAMVNRDWIPDHADFFDNGVLISQSEHNFDDDPLINVKPSMHRQPTRLLKKVQPLPQNRVLQLTVAERTFPGFALISVAKANYEGDSENDLGLCEGALIRNYWVLTSAKCLESHQQGRIIDLTIHFGIDPKAGAIATTRRGTRYFTHPVFNWVEELLEEETTYVGRVPYDFALVLLDHPFITYNKLVNPMRIPDSVTMCTKPSDYHPNETFIDGFDKAIQLEHYVDKETSVKIFDGEFRIAKTNLTFISRDDCAAEFGWHVNVSETQICARDDETVVEDILQDYPRLLVGRNETYGKVDYILGIFTVSQDSAAGRAVYMFSRVCRVWDWIAMTMKRNTPDLGMLVFPESNFLGKEI